LTIYNNRYRSDIDGLRAIAVLSVLSFHLNPSLLPGGFVGVDVFFVISGYLITSLILYQIRSGSFSLYDFYLRRMRRILPALFLILVASLVAACLILRTKDFLWYSRSFIFATFQISNIFFQQDVGYFDPSFDTTPLLHTWSLGVEEQFYLIFPSLLILAHKQIRGYFTPILGIALVGIISFVFSVWSVEVNSKIAFYSISSRFWELSIGALLALNQTKFRSHFLVEIVGIVGIFLLILSFITTRNTDFPGYNALLPCLATAALIFSGKEAQTFTTRFLSLRPLVLIGLISYSLYLWHWPIIAFWRYVAPEDPFSLLSSAIIIISSLILSFLSWWFVELPFRRKKVLIKENGDEISLENQKVGMAASSFSTFIKTPIFVTASIFALLSTLIYIDIQSSDGWTWRLENSNLKKFANSEQLAKLSMLQKLAFAPKCHLFDERQYNKGVRLPENYLECVVTGSPNKIDVLLIGDSHAAHYSTALHDWSAKHGLSFLTVTAGACSIFNVYKGTRKIYCKYYADYVERIFKDNMQSLDYIFIGQIWQDGAYVYDEHSINKIKSIFEMGKKTIVLGQVPSMSITNFDERKPIIGKVNIDGMYRDVIFKNNEKMRQLVDSYDNVQFFDPKPYLCKRDVCSPVNNNIFLYLDESHINKYGSRYLSTFFDFD